MPGSDKRTIPKYPEGSYEKDGILHCPARDYILTYDIIPTSSGALFIYRSNRLKIENQKE